MLSWRSHGDAASLSLSGGPGRVCSALGCHGCNYKFLDAGAALRITNWERGSRMVTSQGSRLAVEFAIQITAGELKDRIGRILLDQRANDNQRFLIVWVIAVEVLRQIEARRVGGENAFGDVAFELPYALALIA